MDSFSTMRRTPTIEAFSVLVKTQTGGLHVGFSNASRNSTLHFQVFGTRESWQQSYSRRRCRPLFVALANAESRDCQYSSVEAPLKPSSPEGKLLSIILQNHRPFFSIAVSGQLEELASDRDQAAAHKKRSLGSMESILCRRIAEIRENERRIAVEDVIYMSIVHKFSEAEIPMVPNTSKCITNNILEMWPSNYREFECIHSLDFQELVKEHLATILHKTEKATAMDGVTTTKTSRLHLGRMYAASILYGYFLKSACFRRELDLRLSGAELYPCGFKCLVGHSKLSNTLVPIECRESRKCDMRREKLSNYVKKFNSETVERCAKLKSKEAVNVIEKHTWALLYDERTAKIDSGDMDVALSSIKRLVFEAVAFGSFLWDIERSVDSVYRLTDN